MSSKLLTREEFCHRKRALEGYRFPVLDQGFVELVDVMGMEQAIAEAARVTSQKEAKSPFEDENLLRYLLRHRHTTPFEMVELKFRVHCPMDVWRQWIRHRMASVNEYSTRYSEAIDEALETGPSQWRIQSTNNRQGSSNASVDGWPDGYVVWPMSDDGDPLGTVVKNDEHDHWGVFLFNSSEAWNQMDWSESELMYEHHGPFGVLTPGYYLTQRENSNHIDSRVLYNERLMFGVAKEQARKDLPLATYTEAIWKIDLHNLLHFLSLRMDAHAQLEIRNYATTIGLHIVQPLYPVVWKAFEDYRLNAMTLTALDVDVIHRLVFQSGEAAAETAATTGFQNDKEAFNYMPPHSIDVFHRCCPDEWKDLKSCRERDECLVKLQRLGLVKT